MTKQEQIEEILEVIKHCGDYTKRDCAECDYRLYGECKNQKQCEAEALYNEGYRKVPFGATVLAPEERNDEIREMHEILEGRDELIAKVGILGRENYDLKAENEQLKAKLEKNPMAIKQKIMEEDDYELTEREQATLFLDRMESDVEILHDIVENLDELLGKGINDYIMGIDGVEGIKDMWERSAVMEFAEKVKEYINDNADFVYKSECGEYAEINITLCEKYINELLREYE